MKTGIQLIQEERQRQIEAHGWDANHDATHQSGELNDAALCYAYAAAQQARGATMPFLRTIRSVAPVPWPWEDSWWKPCDDRLRNLVKAGALIAAEIDRESRARIERKK